MISTVEKFLKKHPARHYVLACSAGIDSMVLLDLFHRLSKSFSVLHVNFGLRGQESLQDAAFVSDRCQQLGIHCYNKKVNLRAKLREQGGNLQQEARNIRYAYLQEILQQKPGSVGVTAHHADDQLENFWLHIIRGSGLSGLSGMEERSPLVARPLLSRSRSSILNYARKNSIDWREDQSNDDTRYLRNFLRKEAMPMLNKAHPSLKRELKFLMQKLKETHRSNLKIATKLAQSWVKRQKIAHKDLLWDESILIEALKKCNIGPRFLTAIQALQHLRPGKQLRINKRLVLIQSRSEVLFIDETTALRIRFTQSAVHQLPGSFEAWTWYLNPAQVQEKLELGAYQENEKMRPNGLKGEKSINAILKAARIPKHDRQHWPVMRCKDEIVGIPGIALAHKFRANSSGTHFVKISFSKW